MYSRSYMKTLLVLFLIFPHAVVPEEGTVYDYEPGTFRQQIEDLDGNFVMFFTPWCRECIKFMRIWEELAELINTKHSNYAIARVDCTEHVVLCNENEVTGFPTLLYYHKKSFLPIMYKGTRDMPSLTQFLNEVFIKNNEIEARRREANKLQNEVQIFSGMAFLTDHNIEKFLSKGQHFIMFYTPWCKASQRLAPLWAELGVEHANNPYVQIGKVNCMESVATCNNFEIKQYPYLLWIVNGRIMGVAESDNHDLIQLRNFVSKMALAENHDPDKFMKKKKALPVARISEETYDTFLEKELVFVNFFAPWCAHCMQLSPLWIQLGEKFVNEDRVLIADIDCSRSKAICEAEKISGLPTLILYKNKKIVSTEHGGRSLDSLITTVNQHLKGTADNEPSESTEDKCSADEQPEESESIKEDKKQAVTKDEL